MHSWLCIKILIMSRKSCLHNGTFRSHCIIKWCKQFASCLVQLDRKMYQDNQHPCIQTKSPLVFILLFDNTVAQVWFSWRDKQNSNDNMFSSSKQNWEAAWQTFLKVFASSEYFKALKKIVMKVSISSWMLQSRLKNIWRECFHSQNNHGEL